MHNKQVAKSKVAGKNLSNKIQVTLVFILSKLA